MRWLAAVGLVGCAGEGGPVDGPADGHCDGVDPVVVDPDACEATASAPEETGSEADEYGDPQFGTSGPDDDCKYHLTWSASKVTRHGPVDFSLTLMDLADMADAVGAEPRIEAFLDETTPAESPGTTHDDGGGKYTISGVTFGEKGRWTVRFHVYEDCVDGETSPHGHASFWLDVP
jgi:hypothetical protein